MEEQKQNIAMDINELVEKIVGRNYIAGDTIYNNGDSFQWKFEFNGMKCEIIFQTK